MPTPFDNNSSFQSLSPEAKQIVLDKFQALSPEAQQIVTSKLGGFTRGGSTTPIPSDVVNEKPVEDVSLTPLVKGEFQKTGEDVSAQMMTRGMINSKIDPYLAATVGTTIAMIPHVVAAMAGGSEAKPAISTAKEAASTVGEAIASHPIAKAIANTGAKEVAALTEKAASLPLEQAAKKTALQGLQSEAKQAIGKAEEKIGVGLSDTSSNTIDSITSDKDKLTMFADRAYRLTEKGADKLAEISSPETLQFYRKVAQKGIKAAGNTLGDIAKSKLYQINKVFGDALVKSSEPFGEAMGRFKDVESVIKELPSQFAKEKQMLKLALVKAKNSAASQAMIRKAVGVAGTAGIAGAGYELGKKALE